MSNVILIYRKEIRTYFALPIGSVLLSASTLLFGLMIYSAADDSLRIRLMGPVFGLTGFTPPRELFRHPVLLVVGFARVMAMFLIPMMTMRLFPEEKQTRTIEMLLTSPVQETDIVLGKWLGALSLYLLIIGVSVVELAFSSQWQRPDWGTILITYSALVLLGGSLLAVGEYMSIFTKHQTVAATSTLLVEYDFLQILQRGCASHWRCSLFAVVTLIGWLLTLRSIRALRDAF